MKNKKETQNVSVEELLEKMTLDEKLQQLTQLSGAFFDTADKTAATGPKEDVGISDNDLPGIGSTLNYRGAEQVRRIQEAHLEADRNKIPMLFMMDVIHGCRTIYPVNLGMGATFNPKLMEECSAMAAREARAMGVRVTFAPMVDLVRDARWGRVMESTGEDAYLNGLFAAAQVKGFQREGVAACVKHFAAYGAPEAGRDYNTVDMSELTLREKYLVAYKAAVDAGVKMVMTSFNSLNGVPAAANRKLVKGILRDEWGFDGVIISDYNAFREMMNHGVAKDEKDCAYKAMQATNDIEMMSAAYLHCMKDLIAEGKISQMQVNDAVRRVLNLKKDLGLLEEPYRFLPKTKEEAEKTQKSEILTAENRVLARIAAEKSAVLLKNKGVLPFKKNAKKIAVIGPFGNTGDIIGFWNCYGNGNDTVKITDGVKNLLPDAEICFAQGVSGALDAVADEKEIEDAARLAAGADVVLLTLGEPEGDSGEGNSKQNLELPEAQYRLLEAVLAANKNTAVLLFSGRPLAIKKLSEHAPAILLVWQPGTEAGNAIANLVFGEVSPEGKLPMSFPAVTGQCPIHYDRFNTGRPRENDLSRVGYASSYIDGPNLPLYPFGYGLSYTEFSYGKARVSAEKLRRGEAIKACVTVKNTGMREATETAQLYLRDKVASVVRPVKELKGFKKVTLAAGEEALVTFEINEEMLKFYNAELEFAAENGDFTAYIGGSSDTKNGADFELVD